MTNMQDSLNAFRGERGLFLKYYKSENLDKRMSLIFNLLKRENQALVSALVRHSIMIMGSPDIYPEESKKIPISTREAEDAVKLFLLALDYLHFSGHINLNFLPEGMQKERDDGSFLITTITKDKIEDLKRKIKKNKNKKNKNKTDGKDKK